MTSNENGVYLKNKKIKITNFLNSNQDWYITPPSASDFAITHSKTHTILVLNSSCRTNDVNTNEQQVQGLIGSIESLTIHDKKTIQVHAREAIEIFAEGKIDGVKTYFLLTTFQKDFCTYDIIMTHKNKSKVIAHYNDFQKFVSLLEI